MKNKALLFSLVFVLLGSLVVGSWGNTAAAEKVYKWKFESFLPNAEPEHSVSLARFCKMVEENTNGRVKITLFPANAIVKVPDMMSATRDGVLEMSAWSCGYGKGAIPLLGVIDGLPMSWQNCKELAEVLYDFGLSELSRQAYTDYGVHLLGHHVQSCCGHGQLAKKPIRTLDDLQGLKLRSHGVMADFWEKLGCATLTIPLVDAYTALATGVADAATCDLTGFFIFKWVEVLKYGFLPGQIGCTGGHIVVNPKAWDSLPADLQTIVNLTWREWAWWHQRYFHPYMRGGPEKVKKKLKKDWGVKFTTLPKADQEKMFKVALEMWDEEAAKDPLAAKGVAIVKDYYRKMGRIK